MSKMSHGSLDAAVRDNRVTNIVSEFSEETKPAGNESKPIEVQQIPFGV
jgi:hypothetical protein